MRELDVLLGRFIERGYDSLDEAGRAQFEVLLDQVDQDILAWIWRNDEPEDSELKGLIDYLRPIVDASINAS